MRSQELDPIGLGVLVRRERGTRDLCAQRKGHLGTEGRCEPRREASGETHPADILILNLQSPEL